MFKSQNMQERNLQYGIKQWSEKAIRKERELEHPGPFQRRENSFNFEGQVKAKEKNQKTTGQKWHSKNQQKDRRESGTNGQTYKKMRGKRNQAWC